MDHGGERRLGMAPVPDDLDSLLTEAQRRSLAELGRRGWQVAFVRRSNRLIPPIVVLASASRERFGVLLDDGTLDFPPDLRLRPGDRREGAA
ncbi:MAG: hypothetical protein KatS3mg124_1147 [Porticoccaceae bacterium]|nr:MAG: hypothetical protein KatS3mg124_1147 [Porticoccaceae bacterium]